MNTSHLTDMEIQQYTFDKTNCEINIVNHMELCDTCKAKAAVYQVLSAEIKNIQSPVFDFNLAGLVLSRIQQPKSKFSLPVFLAYSLAFVLVALLFVSLFFLQGYITNVFNDILPSFYYMVVVSAIIVVVSRGIDIYKNFKNKMNRLNLY
jgi:hypothetical protein